MPPKMAVTPWESPRWSSLCLKDCSLRRGPTLEQFVKKCSLWEGLTLEQLMENCLPWEGLHAGAGEEKSPAPEEEGAAETMCDKLTPTPIPCPPALLGVRR